MAYYKGIAIDENHKTLKCFKGVIVDRLKEFGNIL